MTLPPHETLTSPTNPRVRAAAALRSAAVRRETGLTLVDGRRELARALATGTEVVEVFAAATGFEREDPGLAALLADCGRRGGRITAVAGRVFERIAFGDRNEGIVGVVRFAARSLAETTLTAGRPVLLVEAVEKPGNLGAILRTADATGLAGVVACDPRTDPANPAVIRASLGTVFSVPVALDSTAETIRWCAARGRRVVAAMPDGRRLWHEVPLAGDTALLLGSEAHGLSPAWQAAAEAGEIAWDTVRLPMHGMADSLNVSATAAVLAYESLRQQAAR